MDTTSKDLQLTNSVINLLRASFLGKLVFHGVMTQLGSKLIDNEYAESTSRALDKIEPWIKDLYDNLPIFSAAWKAPETFEAIKAMSFLDELKTDLEWLISQIEKALKVKDLTKEEEAVRFLVAGLARTANTRAFYLDGLGNFLSKFNPQDDLSYLRQQFLDTQEFVQMTHVVFDSFRDMSVIDPALASRLREEASLLPGDFKAQLHDIALLKNSYGGEFTFEKAGFSKEQAAIWETERFSATTAGYWHAYSFTPQEAIQWAQREVFAPSIAANWKRNDFTPETATDWVKAGFAPALAKVWSSAGKDATYAATMVSRGILDPGNANKVDSRRARADAELDRLKAESEEGAKTEAA